MKNFTKEEILLATQETLSMTAAARKLGVRYSTFKRYAEKYNLFAPNPSGKGRTKFKIREDIFIVGKYQPSGVLFRRLICERERKCECCGIQKWRGASIKLEIHHKNGVNTDNRRENLQLLCPNCHSFTDTWRSNSKTKALKVSDLELQKALREEPNIRRALIKVGLSPKGANYNRAYQLLSKLTSA